MKKFILFLLSLLALNNIQSASISNEQIAKLEEQRLSGLTNSLKELMDNTKLATFADSFDSINYALRKLKKPFASYDETEKDLLDRLHSTKTQFARYLEQGRGPERDRDERNIKGHLKNLQDRINVYRSINAPKDKEEAQAEEDIKLARDLPDVLKKIVGSLAREFTPKEIEEANKQFNNAMKEVDVKAMEDALDNGAFVNSQKSLDSRLIELIYKWASSYYTPSRDTSIQKKTIANALNNNAKYEEAVKLLLKYGANPNFVTQVENGQPISAFSTSALKKLMFLTFDEKELRKYSFPLLKSLLEHGANIDQIMGWPERYAMPEPEDDEAVSRPKHIWLRTFRDYLNAPGSEELLKLYNDYMAQKENKEGAEKK